MPRTVGRSLQGTHDLQNARMERKKETVKREKDAFEIQAKKEVGKKATDVCPFSIFWSAGVKDVF